MGVPAEGHGLWIDALRSPEPYYLYIDGLWTLVYTEQVWWDVHSNQWIIQVGFVHRTRRRCWANLPPQLGTLSGIPFTLAVGPTETLAEASRRYRPSDGGRIPPPPAPPPPPPPPPGRRTRPQR